MQVFDLPRLGCIADGAWISQVKDLRYWPDEFGSTVAADCSLPLRIPPEHGQINKAAGEGGLAVGQVSDLPRVGYTADAASESQVGDLRY